MLELLIKRGGNIGLETEGGITPLHMAIYEGSCDFIK